MTRTLNRGWLPTLTLAACLLVGLLLYVYLTDQASPVYPHGEFWPLVSFLFDEPVLDPRAFERVIASDGGVENLRAARQALAGVEPFTRESVEAALRGVVQSRATSPGAVFQPVRVAIAGGTVSPGIFESVALLGREKTLSRIDRALEQAHRLPPSNSTRSKNRICRSYFGAVLS